MSYADTEAQNFLYIFILLGFIFFLAVLTMNEYSSKQTASILQPCNYNYR